jgi:hypothetical protein
MSIADEGFARFGPLQLTRKVPGSSCRRRVRELQPVTQNGRESPEPHKLVALCFSPLNQFAVVAIQRSISGRWDAAPERSTFHSMLRENRRDPEHRFCRR